MSIGNLSLGRAHSNLGELYYEHWTTIGPIISLHATILARKDR